MSRERPATLLHGFTGSAEAWGRPALDCLARAGVVARAIDLPGHGRRTGEADPARFSLGATLAGIRAAHRPVGGALVGYSMGGRLALHFALRHPELVERLVLESASPGLADERERAQRREADDRMADRVEREEIEAFVDAWEALPLFASQRSLPEAVRSEIRRGRLQNDPRSLAASLRGVGTGALFPLWDRLEELRPPTLILVGGLDGKFVDVGSEMADRIPDAVFMVVDGAGHAVHRERPEAWCEAVTSFLLEL